MSLALSSDSSERPGWAGLEKALPSLQQIETERSRRAIERARLAAGGNLRLIDFVRMAWHVLEPDRAFVPGWHLDCLCEHLEAITEGKMSRAAFNVPPGSSKSLVVSVFWPAFEWGPKHRPSLRYIATSYSEKYVKRDSRRMRDLVRSEWYQGLWPHVQLVREGELSFANTATGSREGIPFGSLTGGRADRVIIDDPHSTETAESDAERETTTRIFRESVPTRVNDPKTSAIVVIMQRLHEDDVCGVIDRLGLGYERIILPMEFEPERRCVTRLGFKDPRTREGELLCPARFPREVVDRDKAAMGSYAVAGQFQQRPEPREGGMFKREWFEIVPAAPAGCIWVRHWDLAGTVATAGKDPAWTAGLKLGRAPNGMFYIADVRRIRAEYPDVRNAIKNTASQDAQLHGQLGFYISLPEDPGQAGKGQAQDLVLMLAGYSVKAEKESGEKAVRAMPVAAQCEAKNVKLVRGEWNEAFLDEACLAIGTRISRLSGDRPIEEIRAGDYVMTRQGWRRVADARCTNPRAQTCLVQFSNGKTLVATPNHPILVAGCGFKRVDHLQAGDALLRFTGAPSSISIPTLEIAASPVPPPSSIGTAHSRPSPASGARSLLSRSPLPEGFAADLVVSDIRTLPGERPVFNLEVEDVPEFVAAGIIVHNCKFPASTHADQVDALSGAFNRLMQMQPPSIGFTSIMQDNRWRPT